ncbi:Hypothetical predicted protein [Cloeon dipterum]|uniref:Myb/SANT-like DNA-binding domain-containing protein n=1 Tax=Cloeon dipterum TaxID=197152 RepID=A0A8S1C1X3_9INSE|nr:Hypothetical predicted protein [Cloeon dipterum]
MRATRKRTVQKYFYDSLSGQRKWQKREVFELMRIYESHAYLFGVMSSDEDVWILIASALQENGIQVTARQVSTKWARMRETFKKIGEADHSSAGATKELRKPSKMVSFEEKDVVEQFLLAKADDDPRGRPSLSQSRTRSKPSYLAGGGGGVGRQLDDYETLKAMYKLSLLRN